MGPGPGPGKAVSCGEGVATRPGGSGGLKTQRGGRERQCRRVSREGHPVVLGQVFHMPSPLASCSHPPPGNCRFSPRAQQAQVVMGGAVHGPGPCPADPISLPSNCRLSSEAQQAGPGSAGPGGHGSGCPQAKVKRSIRPPGKA